MLVKNVKFVNDKVEIILENKSFFISKENYIENPLAIDSYVSEEKIEYILNQEKIIETKMKIVKLLNRKALSEKEIYIKLKNDVKEVDAKNIVESLKRMGLVNDEYVACLTIDCLLVKRKGKLEIIKSLKEKGINEKVFSKLIDDIDSDLYINNFNKVLEKYLKMYESRSFKIKKQMVINKLKECGYENELISNVEMSENDEEEISLARINLNKLMKNKKNDISNYENINKIKLKLAMKGFNYDIINKVLEEVTSNETY